MRLSALQKYILKKCLEGKNFRISKKVIENYYQLKNIDPKNVMGDITKSVDRLIRRDLVAGIGKKTAHKWIIQEIVLTQRGKALAKEFLGIQQKFPLHNLKPINKKSVVQ